MTWPVLSELELPWPIHSGLTVAVPAIHWSAFCGFEWNLSRLTANGTSSRKHLALGPGVASPVTLCFPCLSAGGAALGLIGIALAFEEFLLSGGKGEVSTTVSTLKLFIFDCHWMTSFLYYWLELGQPTLKLPQRVEFGVYSVY